MVCLLNRMLLRRRWGGREVGECEGRGREVGRGGEGRRERGNEEKKGRVGGREREGVGE